MKPEPSNRAAAHAASVPTATECHLNDDPQPPAVRPTIHYVDDAGWLSAAPVALADQSALSYGSRRGPELTHRRVVASNPVRLALPPPGANTVTILHGIGGGLLTKTWKLDEYGQPKATAYQQVAQFTHRAEIVRSIEELALLVQRLSRLSKAILIRGVATPSTPNISARQGEMFPESAYGCHWVMVDFDNLPLPDGINPYTTEAIEHCVSKLPREFQGITYFFQHSASAGVLRADGTPVKSGLNAHVFFWLERPQPGKLLAAYFESHCLESEFYERVRDKAGQPLIRYGIDLSVIRSPVQPHYVAWPKFSQGVCCAIPPKNRQGLVSKSKSSVELSALDATILSVAVQRRREVLNAYKRELGWAPARAISVAKAGGVSVSTYLTPPKEHRSPAANRRLLRVQAYGTSGSADEAVILYFAEEASPGSWFVRRMSPNIARRFGDGQTLRLRELSEDAYAHLRDQLAWFQDVADFNAMQLNTNGFLPDIATFANARNSLIEAPTGSGKTTAFRRYVQGLGGRVVIYAAQTIALVDQMARDLREAGVGVTHYRDFRPSDEMRPNVYVTTNESLEKFIAAAKTRGVSYILVIDEVHIAIDDFMRTEKKARLLEEAIMRARQSLAMTATITSLQLAKFTEVVHRACGQLTPDVFSCYRFAPVRSNPLVVKPVKNFGGDFVALLRAYADKRSKGLQLERTVIIVPTTRMRTFKVLLAEFGLTDIAAVVSRQEAPEQAIVDAQFGAHPLLISSPLFALGLNFEVPPARLWTYFTYLDVDTSQIIQTLNRANRTARLCEVRLYVGKVDATEMALPPKLRTQAEIRGFLLEEATIQGLLDEHFHVDRNTYRSLRDIEKDTPKALGLLVENNAFQNFVINNDAERVLAPEADDERRYTDAKKQARDAYDEDVQRASRQSGDDPFDLKLLLLEQAHERYMTACRIHGQLILRDLETKMHGAVMSVCGLSKASDARAVSVSKLFKLLMLRDPFVSEQYTATTPDVVNKVKAEKVAAIRGVVHALKRLKAGDLDGIAFGRLMRRPDLRAGVLALADGDREFIELNQRLKAADTQMAQARNRASDSQRKRIADWFFALARDFLGKLGVTFGTIKVDGRRLADPKAPIVPDWDLDRMDVWLDRMSVSFAKRKSADGTGSTQRPVDGESEVDPSVCRNCVHARFDGECHLRHPVAILFDGIESDMVNKCDDHTRLHQRFSHHTGTALSTELIPARPVEASEVGQVGQAEVDEQQPALRVA